MIVPNKLKQLQVKSSREILLLSIDKANHNQKEPTKLLLTASHPYAMNTFYQSGTTNFVPRSRCTVVPFPAFLWRQFVLQSSCSLIDRHLTICIPFDISYTLCTQLVTMQLQFDWQVDPAVTFQTVSVHNLFTTCLQCSYSLIDRFYHWHIPYIQCTQLITALWLTDCSDQ